MIFSLQFFKAGAVESDKMQQPTTKKESDKTAAPSADLWEDRDVRFDVTMKQVIFLSHEVFPMPYIQLILYLRYNRLFTFRYPISGDFLVLAYNHRYFIIYYIALQVSCECCYRAFFPFRKHYFITQLLFWGTQLFCV